MMRIHSEVQPVEIVMPQKTYNPKEQAKRYSASEQALIDEGGKRVNVRLRGPAMKALARVMKKRGLDQTEAINQILQEATK